MKKTQAVILFLTAFSLTLSACGQKVSTWQEQYDLGVRYLEDGNYEEAIIAFTAAIEIDPKQSAAYTGRGDAYMSIVSTLDAEASQDVIAEYFGNAEKDYLEAVSLTPKDADIYLKLADLYIAMGDREAASAILQQGYEETGNQQLLDKKEELAQGSVQWNSLTAAQQTLFLSLDKAVEEFDGSTVQRLMSSEDFAALFALITTKSDDGKSGSFRVTEEDGNLYELSFWSDEQEFDYWFVIRGDNNYRESGYWTSTGVDWENHVGISHMEGQEGNESGAFKHEVFWPDGRTTVSEGTALNGIRVGTETVTHSDGSIEVYECDQQGNLIRCIYNGTVIEDIAEIANDYPMQASTYRG